MQGNNTKYASERVSSRVNKEVSTPVGDVLVTYSGTSGELVVSLLSEHPEWIRFSVSTENGLPELRATIGKRRPAVGDEITQNGHTFEVTGVRTIEKDRVQVRNESGVWEEWREG